MLNEVRVGAVLLMGGEGRRFGSELPKQFHRLAGEGGICSYAGSVLGSGVDR